VDSAGSGCGALAGSCENINEPLCSIKLLDELKDYHHFEKDSAAWRCVNVYYETHIFKPGTDERVTLLSEMEGICTFPWPASIYSCGICLEEKLRRAMTTWCLDREGTWYFLNTCNPTLTLC
jgi:hypothetical protein